MILYWQASPMYSYRRTWGLPGRPWTPDVGGIPRPLKKEKENGSDKMIMSIKVDINCEESGLEEEKIKDNIAEFASNLIVNGASSEEIGLRVLEVTYTVQ